MVLPVRSILPSFQKPVHARQPPTLLYQAGTARLLKRPGVLEWSVRRLTRRFSPLGAMGDGRTAGRSGRAPPLRAPNEVVSKCL